MADKINSQVILGGGCFWCVEAVYLRMKGVIKVESGYAGGHSENPTYEEVCGKKTGHAEVVRITYDPGEINLENIFDVFWRIHDPTTKDRQGADVGSQYRSIILYADAEQKYEAEKSMLAAQQENIWKDSFVTEVAPLIIFYPADSEHKNYYNLNKMFNPYCMAVIAPKVEKFERYFSDMVK